MRTILIQRTDNPTIGEVYQFATLAENEENAKQLVANKYSIKKDNLKAIDNIGLSTIYKDFGECIVFPIYKTNLI